MAAPALARQKVGDALGATVGQSAPQVHAAHILLPTREAAEAARARVTEGGEDFAAVAREVSTDESTAANGGDLGWFTREEMVAPFAEAAFALEPGAISEPVETEFGWHVIQVTERDPDRPLTDLQINHLQQAAEERWQEEERAKLTVTSTLAPTPTPVARDFTPPVGAPPLPPPTPLPAATTPAATPVGISITARRPGSTRPGGRIDRAILNSGPRRRRSEVRARPARQTGTGAMSQHGRGSGPHDDDPDGEVTGQGAPSRRSSLPPAPAPPIAPYDPYRPMTGDRPRLPTRNIAADPLEPSDRSSRAADDDPFLPADDPLSAEAWQLELDEAPVGGDDEATLSEFDIDAPAPPRRARRQPSSTRSGREPTPGARRAPGAAVPARRARAAEALVPASRSRCRGSSPAPHS